MTGPEDANPTAAEVTDTVVARASAVETAADGWFDELGWELLGYDEARQRWAFDAPGSDFDELIEFYDSLDAWVHTGSVHVPGDLFLTADCGVYVIDGDLTVDGVLRYQEIIQGGAFVVTGDLRLHHLLVESEARLLVLGSVNADGVVACDVSDAAVVEIRGGTTAEATVTLSYGGFTFGHPPDVADESATVLPEFSDADQVYEALRAGRPVLCTRDRPCGACSACRIRSKEAADCDPRTTDIDLSRRNLTRVPEYVFAPARLRHLSLADNPLTELPDNIGDLTDLTHLNLRNTHLSRLPESIGELRRLTHLDLSGLLPNGRRVATLAFPDVVTRLPRLRALDLSATNLADLPDDLVDLAALEELDLTGSLGARLRRLPDLSRLPRLRVLRLSGSDRSRTFLPDETPDMPWTISTLEELALARLGGDRTGRGPCTSLPADAFTGTPRLRRLDLSGNALTTLPESFYHLKHLDFVNLRATMLDPATLDRLRQTFPDVRLDLRHIDTGTDVDDPTWQAVHSLVADGSARLATDRAAAVACFEQAIARCESGGRFSAHDRLTALHGLVEALGRIVAVDPDDELTDKLIGYAERAVALLPEPGPANHLTDEVALQHQVLQRTGNALAWHLLQRGRLEPALSTVDRVLTPFAADPDVDNIRDTKVRILLAMGDVDDAYRIVDTVLSRKPTFADFADIASTAAFQHWRNRPEP